MLPKCRAVYFCIQYVCISGSLRINMYVLLYTKKFSPSFRTVYLRTYIYFHSAIFIKICVYLIGNCSRKISYNAFIFVRVYFVYRKVALTNSIKFCVWIVLLFRFNYISLTIKFDITEGTQRQTVWCYFS